MLSPSKPTSGVIPRLKAFNQRHFDLLETLVSSAPRHLHATHVHIHANLMQLDDMQSLPERFEGPCETHENLKASMDESKAEIVALREVAIEILNDRHSAKVEASALQAEVARLSSVNNALERDLEGSKRAMVGLKHALARSLTVLEQEIAKLRDVLTQDSCNRPAADTSAAGGYVGAPIIAGSTTEATITESDGTRQVLNEGTALYNAQRQASTSSTDAHEGIKRKASEEIGLSVFLQGIEAVAVSLCFRCNVYTSPVRLGLLICDLLL
ncbi:hypothetical protein FA13DRAFT_1796941 [Coprinellus micaceus]|uniref:Uncharacterized protein n=1 Tax=Coprinellus micaceus TaxID=71717 RepID=A0A4Y7SSQ4_COPMI|nr:hypothetical protein FA13DRAFT_1796941 [Coprinellus micaceus]